MSAESRADVETKSKELEDKSGIQLVVATVTSLQGSEVETYANELFRFWKLGEAQKNNGVLLLVAPNEHKVRIEVGYGLEGTLTDALSSVIIANVIVPRFKANDYSRRYRARRRRHHQRAHNRRGRMASESRCPFRRSVGRFQRPVSHSVFLADDFHHLVLDAQCQRPVLRPPRRPTRRTTDLHPLRRGLGRRQWRRFRRWVFRRRRLVGRRRSLGELVMAFGKEDHEAVAATIREAEKRTCGQIVCVLAHTSSSYAYIPILWASALALIIPWPLIYFTQWSVQRIFLLQLVVFIVAALAFCWMPLRMALVPRAAKRARAHRAALEQFVVRRIANTAKSLRRAHLRLARGALCADHRR